mmetsp:Transcript_7894/g.10204  ORF Transcript_7894/g.10204 Transcript_7894/m.10204 type:complete len:207 (+) Transcript_7894:3-623(+)
MMGQRRCHCWINVESSKLMPPKKKEAKKESGDDGADNPQEILKVLNMRNTTLALQLRERTEIISDSLEAKRALEIEVDQINESFSSSKTKTLNMTNEMTGQFENMQELLVDKIVLLSRTVQDLKDELTNAEERFETSEAEKNGIISEKDEDILVLQAKMDDMALEFGSMLQGTLEKMRERIELSTTNNFDADSGVKMMQKKMENEF